MYKVTLAQLAFPNCLISHIMVASNRFLAAALVLASALLTPAMPTGNATLNARAPSFVCGTEGQPSDTLARAYRSRITAEVRVAVAAAAAPTKRVVKVYWSVDPVYALNFLFSHTILAQERHLQISGWVEL
jgi:hypothetical protein